jgi:hypothetical protein
MPPPNWACVADDLLARVGRATGEHDERRMRLTVVDERVVDHDVVRVVLDVDADVGGVPHLEPVERQVVDEEDGHDAGGFCRHAGAVEARVGAVTPPGVLADHDARVGGAVVVVGVIDQHGAAVVGGRVRRAGLDRDRVAGVDVFPGTRQEPRRVVGDARPGERAPWESAGARVGARPGVVAARAGCRVEVDEVVRSEGCRRLREQGTQKHDEGGVETRDRRRSRHDGLPGWVRAVVVARAADAQSRKLLNVVSWGA